MCCNKSEKDNILCKEARLSHCRSARNAAYTELREICILKEFGCKFGTGNFLDLMQKSVKNQILEIVNKTTVSTDV